MHKINLNDEVHFYIDASVFAVDMTVIQFRVENEKFTKVLIMYDSFSLSLTRRKYLIYKRELYAIVIFVTKYDYLCKHSYKSAIIHTDHRSLTHFLKSNAHEEIYDHWANQLKRLNIMIKYILDSRNKIVDDLFKILFFDEDCRENIIIVIDALKKLETRKFDWIWKNEKNDFEKFLMSVSLHRFEIIERDIMNEVSIFFLDAISTSSLESESITENLLLMRRDSLKKSFEFFEKKNIWKFVYEISIWFEEIYFFLRSQRQNATASLINEHSIIAW
jgi:hypothetical protein